MPRVSILVTCYNAEEWIAECIQSVKEQSFTDWECLIGDDRSSDETVSVAMLAVNNDGRFQILHPHDENVGGGENLRHLMGLATGDICVELGGDDFLAGPDALARIVREYDANPRCQSTSGSFVVTPNGGVVTHKPHLLWWKKWCFPKSLTWKREVGQRVLAELGEVVFGLDGKVPRYGWDVAIFMPIVYLSRQHRAIHDITYAYRIHGLNDAKDHRADQLEVEERVCKWLDDRLMSKVNFPWLVKPEVLSL